MIINFDQNSDYYFQNAITAKENGDYLKSFKYIHEAISKEESSEYTLFLASLYMDIEESTVLKNWYITNGFEHVGTKKFDHLPFTSGYLEWKAV